ncbi:MFS transporter [Polyangium fumosum]|uniref:ADP,ATP carrier protein n=2 Tax=Polyangium fumosum TaxID=889272 RepID=A0A4U1J8V5_9BACT|nr:MFS transporter [Polyangium fumosum]
MMRAMLRGFVLRFVQRVVAVRPEEIGAVVWSFVYFFLLLFGYYLIRPLRDAMGIAGGEKALPWLFSATFGVMLCAVPLYGALVTRLSRRRLVPVVHRFFAANLLLFFVLASLGVPRPLLGRVFFVWTSVYNLFVVSVLWSFLVDVFTSEQGKRLFGVIAAGGSAGAIVGPLVTAAVSKRLGQTHLFWLLVLAAVTLEACVLCARRAEHYAGARDAPAARASSDKPVGGSLFAGIRLIVGSPYLAGIALAILLLTTMNTFLYLQKTDLVRRAAQDSAAHTALFAWNDTAVNVVSAALSLFLTGRLMTRLGLAAALAVLPVLSGLGFSALAVYPSLAVVAVVEGLRRAAQYAIERPAREVLYTVLPREAKYKAKSFIDTVVFRGGDAVSAWAHAGLLALGLSSSGVSLIAVPLAGLWLGVALFLARREKVLAEEGAEARKPDAPAAVT